MATVNFPNTNKRPFRLDETSFTVDWIPVTGTAAAAKVDRYISTVCSATFEFAEVMCLCSSDDDARHARSPRRAYSPKRSDHLSRQESKHSKQQHGRNRSASPRRDSAALSDRRDRQKDVADRRDRSTSPADHRSRHSSKSSRRHRDEKHRSSTRDNDSSRRRKSSSPEEHQREQHRSAAAGDSAPPPLQPQKRCALCHLSQYALYGSMRMRCSW